MKCSFSKNHVSAMWIAVAAAAVMVSTAAAQFQPTFSVDVQSASVPGLNDPGSILTPQGSGQLPPPAVVIPSAMLGINLAGTLSELDALSYGTEPLLQKGGGVQHRWTFSVDEFAVGRPGVPGPSVTTEGAFSSFPEAAGDIYVSNVAPGPIAPFAGVNTGLFDGNGGLTPFAAPGLNLREPANPTVGLPDAGDNLDAWDLDQAVPMPVQGTVYPLSVYFSLDSHFVDPLEAPQAINTGSAIINGFVGGDVLVSTVNGNPPSLFAAATQLGLDKNGPDSDDLDALVLWENGDGAYTPTAGPYSWAGGATDMLLFSVRRNSAVIGQIDPLLGLPIEEGDILVPMGNPGQIPGIFVPAEALGLATIRTNGTAATFQGFGDDLDALDVQQTVPEPSSGLLMVVGVCGWLARRRGRQLQS